MKKISVGTAPSYDVLISNGLLDQLGTVAAKVTASRQVAVITDDLVDNLYGERACQSMKAKGFSLFKYIFPHGESSKNLTVWGEIINFLAQNHFTRCDLVVALGGGVVGDITGFAAACYQRGIPFIQVPTTLLAAIDSSVGGKTAVDLPFGKNLVGAFYQPALVVCDPLLLQTLPSYTLADGITEALKTGVIGDKTLFSLLEKEGFTLTNGEEIIYRCIDLKRQLVEKDPFDKGDRQLLNLGHTIGHAIENLSNYNISHGTAVAMGMTAIAQWAWRAGYAKENTAPVIAQVLKKWGVSLVCPYGAKELAQAALYDKKRSGNNITLVLPVEIGHSMLHTLPVEELEMLFSLGLEA